MLTTGEIREKLKDANLWKVAELAQINPQTLYRFMQGRDIRHVTLEQLSKYLETIQSLKNLVGTPSTK